MARAIQWHMGGRPVDHTLPDERIVLTVPEVALALGIGRDRAYRACRRGELPTIRIGRRILVSRAALEHFVSTAQVKSSPASHHLPGTIDDRGV